MDIDQAQADNSLMSLVAWRKYDFSMMGEKLVSFTRDEFADYAIECFKLSKDESKYGKEVMMYTLLTILSSGIRISLLTEALTGILKDQKQPLSMLMSGLVSFWYRWRKWRSWSSLSLKS
jgi:hypothetical protein